MAKARRKKKAKTQPKQLVEHARAMEDKLREALPRLVAERRGVAKEKKLVRYRIKKPRLEKLRAQLLEERDRLREELPLLARYSLASEMRAGDDSTPGYSIHMADDASESEVLDTFMGIRSIQEERLIEVEEALKKINEGTYGICEGCEKTISMERLTVLPEARFCVECQRKMERKP